MPSNGRSGQILSACAEEPARCRPTLAQASATGAWAMSSISADVVMIGAQSISDASGLRHG